MHVYIKRVTFEKEKPETTAAVETNNIKIVYAWQLPVQLQLLLSAAASSAGSPHSTASPPETHREQE